jgi:hypothetical protein
MQFTFSWKIGTSKRDFTMVQKHGFNQEARYHNPIKTKIQGINPTPEPEIKNEEEQE